MRKSNSSDLIEKTSWELKKSKEFTNFETEKWVERKLLRLIQSTIFPTTSNPNTMIRIQWNSVIWFLNVKMVPSKLIKYFFVKAYISKRFSWPSFRSNSAGSACINIKVSVTTLWKLKNIWRDYVIYMISDCFGMSHYFWKRTNANPTKIFSRPPLLPSCRLG